MQHPSSANWITRRNYAVSEKVKKEMEKNEKEERRQENRKNIFKNSRNDRKSSSGKIIGIKLRN